MRTIKITAMPHKNKQWGTTFAAGWEQAINMIVVLNKSKLNLIKEKESGTKK
jgi:hypothetical protein